MSKSKEYLDSIRELSVQACKKAAREREDEYLKNPKLCLHCGKPLPYKGHKNKKFCNKSCAASYNNTKRTTASKETRYCKYCGKPIIPLKGDSWKDYANRKYCCFECYVNDHYHSFIEKWKKGEVSGSAPSGGINETVRKYILNKYNYKCAKCGWSEKNPYTGNIPLEIHHIDGNSDNNSEDNLIVLCPCCHSLTKNYRGGNTRSKRSKYRKNYKERLKKL